MIGKQTLATCWTTLISHHQSCFTSHVSSKYEHELTGRSCLQKMNIGRNQVCCMKQEKSEMKCCVEHLEWQTVIYC